MAIPPGQEEFDYIRQGGQTGRHRGPQSADRIEPKPPKPKHHTIARWSTYTVIGLAIAWIIAANVLRLHPSRFTFTSALCALIIYASSFAISMERPRTIKRGFSIRRSK